MDKKNSLQKMIMDKRSRFREMSTLEACQAYLRLLLQVMVVGYLTVTGMILPLYFNPETDYLYIAEDKMELFAAYGFRLAGMFGVVLLLLVVVTALWWISTIRHRKMSHGDAFECSVREAVHKAVGHWGKQFSTTDKFMLLYGVSLVLSYACSPYKGEVLMGAKGWYMGLLPQLIFVGSYFAISRLLPAFACRLALVGMLGTAFVVFLLGFFNRFGWNPLGMESSGYLYLSTIGNINWYCGYWSVLFPLGAGVFLFYPKAAEESRQNYVLKKCLLGIFTVTGIVTGLTQGSDSGVVSLAALVMLVGFLIITGQKRRQAEKKNLWKIHIFQGIWRFLAVSIVVTLVSFAVLLAVNTISPGSIGVLSENPWFTFSPEWGSNRGGTWMAGLRVWWEQDFLHKITGVGPDGMVAYLGSGLTSDGAAVIRADLQAQFGTWKLTNAHNEWLTLLVNVGILGMIGFVGVIISSVVRFLRGSMGQAEDTVVRSPDGEAHLNRDVTQSSGDVMACGASHAVLCACALSLFTYTINNMFSFQQIMNITQLFIVLGLGENMLREKKKEALLP